MTSKEIETKFENLTKEVRQLKGENTKLKKRVEKLEDQQPTTETKK